jgi:iron complex transport system ATP-binding protein
MKEEIFVECKSISVGYHERSSASIVVRRDLSLRAFGGEMVALIGQNGIGKSTLLKTIAGFQPLLSGELLIRDKPISAYSANELAKEMSFVSTEIVRVANLTVNELVSLGRFPHTDWFGQLTERDHEIVMAAISQVGLSGYENRLIGRISDGERQRAMIARALAQDTPIVVLDEPTAFLDLSNKYEIVHILHKLAFEQGKCIIFSTHELATALSVADRIWLITNDKSIEGIPEEVASKGYFQSLFPDNHHLYFDAERSDFRVRKEICGTISLDASGQDLIWATKALERLGFYVIAGHTVSESPGHPVVRTSSLVDGLQPPVSIRVTRTATGWILKKGDITAETETLEELCRAAKGFMLPRLS